MADDRVQRERTPRKPEPRPDFPLVRPYVSALADPESSDWRTEVGPMVSGELPESATMVLPLVPSSRRGARSDRRHYGGLTILSGVSIVVVFVVASTYLLWTSLAAPTNTSFAAGPVTLASLPTVGFSSEPMAQPTPTASPSVKSQPTAVHHDPTPAPIATASTSGALGFGAQKPSVAPTGRTATGQITGVNGLCLDDNGGVTANGNKLQVFSCNGSAAQQWTVEPDGTIRVIGKCMKASSSQMDSIVELWDCDGSKAEVWRPSRSKSLVNSDSGMCLDIQFPKPVSGSQLVVIPCFGRSTQSWTLPS